MTVQEQITRIQNDRNTIRTKLHGFSLVELTANLDDCATAIYGIVDRGTPSIEVQEGGTQTLGAGYYHGGTVTGVPGGGSYTLQEKSTTPTKSEQVITPDPNKYGLSKVTVAAIPAAYQDVTSVTATAADVLTTKAFVDSTGAIIAGMMPNRGAVSKTLDTTTTSYPVPVGYHNGLGSVGIVLETKSATPTTSAQDITPTAGKVLSKVTIGAIQTETKSTTPTTSSQSITPTSGKYLTEVTVNAIPSNFIDSTTVDAVAANVLTGKKAVVNTGEDNWAVVTGTMSNRGAVSPAGLNCGGSYTIPAGYHNGSGIVTANSLASQTGVDEGKTAVTASQMLTGYQGWVSGTKITGTMPNNGAISGTITGLGAVTGDTSYTIPAGYTSGGTVSLTNDIETALAAI